MIKSLKNSYTNDSKNEQRIAKMKKLLDELSTDTTKAITISSSSSKVYGNIGNNQSQRNKNYITGGHDKFNSSDIDEALKYMRDTTDEL